MNTEKEVEVEVELDLGAGEGEGEVRREVVGLASPIQLEPVRITCLSARDFNL